MNFKKYIALGIVALGLGMTSCVGDLDLQPNDPNLVDTSDKNFNDNTLAMCYSGIACSGISGPGSSYVGGLDAGTSAYLRMVFTLGEFCTDECIWIWSDAGVPDITACTWSDNNGLLTGAYYRFLGHIALCNQYLKNTGYNREDKGSRTEEQEEARVLRAFSYYNMIDLFGQSSFITDEAEAGAAPVQISRAQLFAWLEKELLEIVNDGKINKTPVYGRVGLDGAEALLARLYLNAEVFSGEARWADCQKHCENIIARHQGQGFEGSGLVDNYLYLFCRENGDYMPGGTGTNEILFGIAFDDQMTQSYGGPTFVIAATISNTHYIPRQNYGCSSEWSCLRGCKQMAEKFYGLSNDVRDDLWLKGGTDVYPAGSEGETTWEAEDYQDVFQGFTGEWKTTGGNAIIKFTGRYRNAAKDGGWDMEKTQNNPVSFASTAQPVIRLADMYLMYAECFVNGGVGDQIKALNYVQLVQRRAGLSQSEMMKGSELTKKGIMDERSREFYLESTRRTDLIRNGMFVGPQQEVWQYKGSINNNDGTRIASKYALYPIPHDVIATQPEFKQNPGY